MRHVRNDAMCDSILSRPLSRRIEMEPTRVRGSLRRDRLRRLCACNARNARATGADQCVDATGESIFACLSDLRACAKLDVFAAALAQFLNCMASVSDAGVLIVQLQNLCPCPSICG